MFSYLFVIAISLLALPVWAEVGHVMFVSGKAQVQTVDGKLVDIVPGYPLDVGQRIITQASGYVHLKMIDNAFYSLRPNSRFVIEHYNYQSNQSENNRVKTVLESGSVRAITGEAGEKNKQGYRLNTPVAAIGVRGTDYIVNHEQDVTRVAVSAGAVVVSPFNAECASASFGACAGVAAMVLAANMNGDYIEVKRDQAVPEKKRQGWMIQAQLPAVVGGDNNANNESRTLANLSNDKLAPTPSADANRAFQWGRWQDASITDKLNDDQWHVVGGNVGFLVVQQADSRLTSLPNQVTQAQFTLSDSVAAFRGNNGQWQPASVTQGGLVANFKDGSFSTVLAGRYTGGDWQLNAQGAVTPTGALISSPYRSDAATWVTGGVDKAVTQAAYEFDKRLVDGAVVGVAYWRVKP